MILLTPPTEVHGAATDRTLAKLTQRHLTDLRASGLSDQQIARCGFHSLQAPARIQAALRWHRYKGELGDCLAFLFVDAEGKATGYIRLKPDRPRKSKDGKPIKYESPKGAGNRAFFPPGTLAALKDSSIPLVLTEGEKKAAKADQEGFSCIGLVGVYGWQKKRPADKDGKPVGERELIDDLSAIPWKGRPVYLCFDSDAATNPNVRNAEWHLAEVLARRGASVKVIRMPQGEAGPDGKPAKVGLDDFLVAHGSDAFCELIAAAVDPTPPERKLQPIEVVDDPSRLAQLFRNSRCKHADGLTLRFRQEQWWRRWIGNHYRLIPDAELRAELCEFVRAEFLGVHLEELSRWEELPESERGKSPLVHKITTGLIANVEMALASMTVMAGDVALPTWWDGKTWNCRKVIALSNGLLDLDALFGEKSDALLAHSPRWFSPTCLPYLFDPDADCPRWLAFLKRNLEDDRERIDLLQEWFGLCLMFDTSR